MKLSARLYRRLAASAVVVALVNPTGISLADQSPVAPEPVKNLAPVYGDLTHLTFTATGDLRASLVSPIDGGTAAASSAPFEVETVRGGGVELRVNGTMVSFEHIGRRTVNNKTGETHYFYYGVSLQEGANAVELTPLGADGARGSVVKATVYGPGLAVRLDTSFSGSTIADGHTPVLVRIAGYDRYGNHAAPGSVVRLSIVRGDGHFVGQRYGNNATATAAPVSVFGSAGTAVDVATSASATPATAITVPQTTTTPFPFASTPAGPTPGPQLGDAGNWHAIGDTDGPLQSVEVPLGLGGVATIPLVPGLQAGELRLRAEIGSVKTESQIFLSANIRKPMVLGLATTGVGSVPGVPGELVTQADGANARRGRIALYGVGKVAKNAQVQIAYDTADSLNQTSQYGGNTDNPTERLYQTYGDGSTRRDDALSRDHLFARLDAGHSSAMWGEFQANTAGSTGDGFSQLVAGAKVEIGGRNVKGSVFNAHNDVAYSRQIFSPTGLATIGALLHPNIVVGSDIISLVSLDRRTGAVVGETVMQRNVDYTLDYSSGQIHFINVPLPFDLNFNPQQILAEYEYDGVGVTAQTTGGRIDAGIGGSQALRIGAGYVNDSTGAGNFALLGQDLTGKLAGGGFTISHETSQGSLTSIGTTTFGTSPAGTGIGGAVSEGNAYRATFSNSFGANKITGNFDATSPGFSNPFGGISTAGLLDYRVAYQRLIGKSNDSVSVSFDHEQNNLAAGVNSTSNVAILAQAHVTSRLKVRGGLNAITSGGGTFVTNTALGNQVSPVATPLASATAGPVTNATTSNNGTTTQVDIGAEYKIAPQVVLGVDRIASLGGPEQASQPTQTTAQLTVDIPHGGKAYVRQLWSDAPVQSFAAATSSLTSATGSTRSTAVGLEEAIGHNTTVDTEYAIENTGNGSDIYSSIGGREHFNLGANLHGDGTFQHAASVGSDGGSFNLYGLSLAYAAGTRFRATTQYQLRTGFSSGYTLSVGAAGAINDNISALVSSQVQSTTGYSSVDDRLSFAYRPSLNDRAVTLVGYEALDGNQTAIGTHTQLLSLEELYRPDRMLEIAGRYAYKLDGDDYYPAHSSLFGLRVTQRVGHRFDVAAETRFLTAHNIAGESTTGFAVEAGYRVGGEMRLAAGYNFSGSPDPSLAIAPTRRGVYATATSVIDRIFGWGKDNDL